MSYTKTREIYLDTNKVLVVSDAHIGLDTGDRPHKVINHLLELAKSYDYLILNGDMLELWRYGKFAWSKRNRKSKVHDLLHAYPKLLDVLLLPNVIFLHGNHDYVTKQMELEFPVYTEVIAYASRVLKEDKVYIAHGNDADKLNSNDALKKKGSIFIELSTWLLDKFYELTHINETAVNEAINKVIFSAGENKQYPDYITSKLTNFETVIFGHTHIHDSYKLHNGQIYANSGSCVSDTEGTIQGIELYKGLVTLKTFPQL